MEENELSKLAEELDSCRIRSRVYRKIIERYQDFINEQEKKTVPELKALINGNDYSVQQIRNRLLEEIKAEGTPEEEVFLKFVEKVYAYLISLKPIHSELSVSYWLSTEDIIELGAADVFDKAILACSLLHSVDCKNARIRVVELEGGFAHPLVLFEFKGVFYLLDPSQKFVLFKFSGSADEALKTFSFEGRKFLRSLYEFNDRDYFDFSED